MITSVSVVDWKIDPGLFQLVAQQRAVDQIAVMRDRDRPLGIFDDKGLGVFEMALALGRIAVVADGAVRLRAA